MAIMIGQSVKYQESLKKQLELNLVKAFRIFQAAISSIIPEKFIRENHNEWYSNFDKMIKMFLICRKNFITNAFLEKLPKSEDFVDQIKLEVLFIEQKLDIIASNLNLCLRKCSVCEFSCTKILYHKDDCQCGTDHICIMNCTICKEQEIRCNLLNGHKDKHYCKLLAHKCTELCKIQDCGKACTKAPGHEDACMCSSSHPCGEKCEMFLKCGQLCRLDKTSDHKIHDCLIKKCPYSCIFNDGKDCCNLDHFHEKNIDPEPIDPKNIEKKKPHLCGKSHTCIKPCESEGVCLIEARSTVKVYKNKYNEFSYPYVNLSTQNLLCKNTIDPSKLFHLEEIHTCSNPNHTCARRCPDCNCFCDLKHGHEGLHHSRSHRNKECSEYISIDDHFKDVLVDQDKKTTITIVAGDSASPEISDQYCLRKDRGHCHPIPCKGGDLCLAITDIGFAIHSKTNYKGSTTIGFYDLVTCETYWKKQGWEPPVDSINPEAQRLFGKCNFSCGHPSHVSKDEKVFCEENLFHSTSLSYDQHNFKCTHEGAAASDIVFIIDCTGSMGAYFVQVKNVISNLLKKWGSETNKFSIVGYTDHAPDHGHFPASNPVMVFPSSKNLNDGDPLNAATFIGQMTVGGGGGMMGEALIDGLAEANSLNYRPGMNRIYILVCDDSPHGDEFLAGTSHPRGCPCGKNWRALLNDMKNKKTQFIFVKLSEILNKTVELFQSVYGGTVNVMSLNSVSDFEVKVTNVVVSTIERNLVMSQYLKKK